MRANECRSCLKSAKYFDRIYSKWFRLDASSDAVGIHPDLSLHVQFDDLSELRPRTIYLDFSNHEGFVENENAKNKVNCIEIFRSIQICEETCYN